MSDHSFKVFMYGNELKFLKWLVMQKPRIETGGDLFGLWQDEDTAVVQFILGPGQNCSRTTASFHQDIEYLENAGQYLTSCEGLCNIGEWHSHHRIGLTSPSGGDKDTVWNHISSVSGGRFLLFIAHIKDSSIGTLAEVRCFLFNNKTKKMSLGELIPFGSCSPVRHTLNRSDREINFVKRGYEKEQDWKAYSNYVLRQTAHYGSDSATAHYGSDSGTGHYGRFSGKVKFNTVGDIELDTLTSPSWCVCDTEDYPTATDDHLSCASSCCMQLRRLCHSLCECCMRSIRQLWRSLCECCMQLR